MKRFAAVTLVALMLLTVFASAANAANASEIRGPVYNGSNINKIIAEQGGSITIDASRFAAFYYDIDDNVTTETLSIKEVAGTKDNVIGEGGLVYTTTIKQVSYDYDKPAAGWSNYSLIGFFADKYIPLKPTKADKLAKLVLDSNDKYTVRTGEKLDLGQGYAIEAKQVDVDGKKVWLAFSKDGEFIDDEIIEVGTGDSASNTWNVELDDIQGEDDVVVLKLHVNQVFQGAVDSIAQIEGLWLIDYANAMTIESDDEFGELNKVSISGSTLKISNDDTFTLTRDSEEAIGQGMSFKIADTSSNELRYYPFVEMTVGENVTVGNVTTPGNVTVGNVTTPGNVSNVTETPTEGNVTETPTEGNVTTPAEGDTPATNETTTEEGPGFGFVFGLVGLLAVVYLVRRNN